ncbi:MAG: glycoside hydrolase family 88 protein, partial [Sediminibacterium sp.]
MKIVFLIVSAFFCYSSHAQVKGNDVTTPLHLLQPSYHVPYGAPSIDNVKKLLKKVFTYLD